ncbi:MAG: hypothetical protein XD51_0384 [Moorella sp. 60_41]|nr:MAG: hypothetical protein XD51_0384 [Moorella sp. 60_41]
MAGRPVIFLYICPTGTTAALAAALHLEQLPPDRCPPWEEFLALPGLKLNRERGKLFFAGRDSAGRPIYYAAVGPHGKLAGQITTSFLALWGLPGEAVKVMEAGGRVSSLVFWGWRLKSYLLMYWGLRRSWRGLSRWVSRAKDGDGGWGMEPGKADP